VSFLSKLNLPESDETEDLQVKSAALLIASIRIVRSCRRPDYTNQQKCPLADASSKNALVKFDSSLLKKYPTELAGFEIEEFGSDEREQVKALVEFIDSV